MHATGRLSGNGTCARVGNRRGHIPAVAAAILLLALVAAATGSYVYVATLPPSVPQPVP